MTDGAHGEALAAIQAKLELVKRVEAEHNFGVIIEEPRRLEPIGTGVSGRSENHR